MMAMFWTTSFVIWTDEIFAPVSFVFRANDAGTVKQANAATTESNNGEILFMGEK
jgi:hypothetical protein